jgi:hypothetical protein
MSLSDKVVNLDKGIKEQMIIQWITTLCNSFVTDEKAWSEEHHEIDDRIKTGCIELELFRISYNNGKYSYHNELCHNSNLKKLKLPQNLHIDDFGSGDMYGNQSRNYYYNVNGDSYFSKCCFYIYRIWSTIHVELLINRQKKVCEKCLTEHCKHKKACVII